ncbi:MAG TPA: hypothetical protein VF221_20205 [Chloroflexota bacterium]
MAIIEGLAAGSFLRLRTLAIIVVLNVVFSRTTLDTALAGSHLVPGQPRALTMQVEAQAPKHTHEVTVVGTANPHLLARLVDELNTLPVLEAVNCPLDRGPFYRMVFQYANGTRRVVDVDATGCKTVHARGMRPRTALNHPALYSDLNKVMQRKA